MGLKRALVTGASGFIGQRLVRALLAANWSVTAVGRSQFPDGCAQCVRIDLGRIDVTDLLPVGSVDVVFHLAAAGVLSGRQGSFDDLMAVNIRSTGVLAEWAAASGVSRFVHCGSCFEYGGGDALDEDAPLSPFSRYGASKAAGSLVVSGVAREADLPVSIVRPFTVYGPGEAPQRLLPYVIESALSRQPMKLTDGKQVRDLVHVDDVVSGLVAAGTIRGGQLEVFNLGTGIGRQIRDVVREAISQTGAAVDVEFGALPRRTKEPSTIVANPRHAYNVLGWRPQVELRDGLREYVESMRGGL